MSVFEAHGSEAFVLDRVFMLRIIASTGGDLTLGLPASSGDVWASNQASLEMLDVSCGTFQGAVSDPSSSGHVAKSEYNPYGADLSGTFVFVEEIHGQ